MRTYMRVARGALGTLSLQVTCTAKRSFPDNELKGNGPWHGSCSPCVCESRMAGLVDPAPAHGTVRRGGGRGVLGG